jgi:hypothetical protein
MLLEAGRRNAARSSNVDSARIGSRRGKNYPNGKQGEVCR